MKIYVVSIDNVFDKKCYTSLKMACESIGVPYSTAKTGVRIFKTGTISETELIKIKGRGKNNFS